jgi:hypothetical protein
VQQGVRLIGPEPLQHQVAVCDYSLPNSSHVRLVSDLEALNGAGRQRFLQALDLGLADCSLFRVQIDAQDVPGPWMTGDMVACDI